MTANLGNVLEGSDKPTRLHQKVIITPLGGIAVSLTNKTGGVSAKGYMVRAGAAVDNSFVTAAVDIPDVIGVVYGDINGDQVADGAECYVVTAGIAEVYFGGNTTRGNFIRNTVAADGYAAGQALAEALPTAPFATDKHFHEIGHVLETRVGAGLAKGVLHFN